VADLAPVARVGQGPLLMVMNRARPQQTLAEVLAAVRASPRDWPFAVSSLGAAGHLATIEFTRQAGVDLTHVPYRGTAPALTDVVAGNVQLMFDPDPGDAAAGAQRQCPRALHHRRHAQRRRARDPDGDGSGDARASTSSLVGAVGPARPAARDHRPHRRGAAHRHVRADVRQRSARSASSRWRVGPTSPPSSAATSSAPRRCCGWPTSSRNSGRPARAAGPHGCVKGHCRAVCATC
jgi:hypothetical protein